MTPEIVIRPTPESVADVLLELREKQARGPIIISRALNKTAVWVRARVVRAVAGEIVLPQKEIRKGVELIRASRARLRADVRITGRRIPLLRFGARQTKKGVSYRVSKRKGRTTVPGAFLESHGKRIRMKSGHQGVFARAKARGDHVVMGLGVLRGRMKSRTFFRHLKAHHAGLDRVPRLPIQELMGPSIPGVVQHAPDLLQRTLVEATERTQMELRRQVEVLIAQRGGGLRG